MLNDISRRASCLLFLFVLAASAAFAQVQPDNNVEQPAVQVISTVTASATSERVRFSSPNTVVQLRLEVYDEGGQKLLDTEQRGGNVIDWHLQGGAGDRVSDGVYLCVLTIKNLTGRISQKLGQVTINAQASPVVRSAAVADLNLRQTQTVGPIDMGEAGLTVMGGADAPVTVLANNGSDAQLARTRGALTFRVGDFFSGNDKEQMRLTEEGNLGLGTTKPKAKLDVAGLIRAGAGFMFSDGSTLNVNEKGVLTRTSAAGVSPSVVTTQNKLAKFTDNAGSVGDSVVTELSGNIGINNSSPASLLHLGQFGGYGATTGMLLGNNLLGSQFDRALQVAPVQTANPSSNSILIYTLPTVNPGVTVPLQYGFFIDGKQGPGAITSYAALATGQAPSLNATNNTHLLMGQLAIPTGNYSIYDATGFNTYHSGRVGIGTATPTAKFTVNGSGVYNATGAARFDLFNTTAGSGFLQHVTDTGDWQIATTTGNTRMLIDSSGNVSIGTDPGFPRPFAQLQAFGGPSSAGVLGVGGANGYGVYGLSPSGRAVVGESASGYAGYFFGKIHVDSIPAQGLTTFPVCTTAAGDIVQCTSSLRFKTNVHPFLGGLDIIRRLHPINYNWKEDGKPDIGLGAEDVAKVAPSFAITDSKGEITGVKYERLNIVLINAVKEQQQQITQQQLTAKQQQGQIAALRTANTALNARLRLIERTLKTKRGPIRRRR